MVRPVLRARRDRNRPDQRGAAAVEFALLMIPLLLIVFGIISYGVMLSFRQTVSQAATEGARAAAVEMDAAQREATAEAAIEDALATFGDGYSCGDGTLACNIDFAACVGDGSHECVTVELVYDYEADPVVPTPPLLGAVFPDELSYAATARVS